MTAADYGLPERVTCPFCHRDETELLSPFGPQLSVATYWCRTCHTAFDWLKWSAHAGADARPTGKGGPEDVAGTSPKEGAGASG